MKKSDLLLLLFLAALFLPFMLSTSLFQAYDEFNKAHGMIMSFIKFGILATLGELIGQRIRTGNYFNKNFGILPKAIIWGFLGLTINMAFVLFSKGTPAFLAYLGFDVSRTDGFALFLIAFSISTLMNLIYAPVMMTLHAITDRHVQAHQGRLSALYNGIRFGEIMQAMDWRRQWSFVFARTIPFFWIPAHTITFLLPTEFRVLFAAILGIVLGIILALASRKQ